MVYVDATSHTCFQPGLPRILDEPKPSPRPSPADISLPLLLLPSHQPQPNRAGDPYNALKTMAERQPTPPNAGAAHVSSHARSPSSDLGGDRKRRRKVLSCYDCRRRKLQCDRAVPACGRCIKSGQASKCVYLDDTSEAPAISLRLSQSSAIINSNPQSSAENHGSSYKVPAEPPAEFHSKIQDQDARIRQLEIALARPSYSAETVASRSILLSKLPPTPESVKEQQTSTSINDRETMLLRGKSFETQFSGTTHPLSLIAHVPELNSFTKEALEVYPSFQHAKRDMGTLEARVRCADKEPPTVDDKRLEELLPPRADVDLALHLYFESYDLIYHVVHTPSFWSAYNEMWQAGLQNASQHTVALVLLMIACVSCLAPAKPWIYVANSSRSREDAIEITQACERWINKQSQKRVSAADFQIRFLLCLTKQTTARKYKRSWTDTGNLLRFCMSAGLHRNPDLIRKPTTSLDKQLRRRIWAAVVDMELQASFDRGMISAPFLLQSDSPGPDNLHDEDAALEQTPAPLPASQFTRSWYLSLANGTVTLRSNLNTLLNDIRHVISFDEVKQYSDEIESHLRSIPESVDPQSEEARRLLHFKLLQYQLAIHNRFVRIAATNSERDFSVMTIIDTASKIIELHQALNSNEKRSLQFLGYDLLRAALAMANVVSVQHPLPRGALSSIIFHHTPLIEQAIDMLNDKAARLGCEQRQLWVALAANGFIKAQKDPGQRAKYMQEAVEVVTRVYYNIMACQDFGAFLPSTEGPLYQRNNSKGIVDYLPEVAGVSTRNDSQADLSNSTLFNLEEFAAWTFEDWMLDPNDVLQSFDTF